jgi:radical SAM protein with 4Fe4S-binding SPASM domain
MFKSKYKLTSVAWEITLACNMKCMHCGSSAGKSRLNELTTNEALDLCNQFNDLNVEIVNLTGGEPILRKDWFDIGKKIKDLGMDLSLLSNGLALDEKTISLIRKLEVYTMGLSIDGGIPKTHDTMRGINGSFEKCILSLELLKKENIPTTVITTVHKGNIRELNSIKEKILDLANAWQIQIAAPIGRFPKNLILSKEEYYSLALYIAATRKKYHKKLAILGAHSIGYHSQILRNTMLIPLWKGCQAGITTVGIQSDGGVKGCLSLPDSFIEGNIRKKNFIDIWNDHKFASYIRDFKKENLKNNCKECKYGKSCKGGCSTMSMALTNELHCNPYCLYLLEKELITG